MLTICDVLQYRRPHSLLLCLWLGDRLIPTLNLSWPWWAVGCLEHGEACSGLPWLHTGTFVPGAWVSCKDFSGALNFYTMPNSKTDTLKRPCAWAPVNTSSWAQPFSHPYRVPGISEAILDSPHESVAIPRPMSTPRGAEITWPSSAQSLDTENHDIQYGCCFYKPLILR